MADRKIEMVVIDGVRYRPEDAPSLPIPEKKAAPKRTATKKQ